MILIASITIETLRPRYRFMGVKEPGRGAENYKGTDTSLGAFHALYGQPQ
jgi:hypothetical protein